MTREEFFYQCMDIIEHWLNGNRKLSDLRQVTDKLYNEVTKSHWISVEDELSTKYDSYLTRSMGNVIEITHYNIDGWHTESKGKVTHWMPMPSVEHLKKEDKNE